VGFPPAFAAFLRHFAAGAFFEAHEDLEGLWRQRDADPFLQGLILLAAAHVKVQRGNAAGARRHFAASARYLAPYAPAHLGVDVAALLAHAAAAGDAVAAGRPVPVPAFPLLPGAESAWDVPAPAAPGAPALAAAVAEALAARRASGAPVGPASWAPLVKEVVRLTGGRFPLPAVRSAVRAALGPSRAMPSGDGA
jgi:hypothetical protein